MLRGGLPAVRHKTLDHLASGWDPLRRRLEVSATGSAAFSISDVPSDATWTHGGTRRRPPPLSGARHFRVRRKGETG